jgi:6-phosphogluconolactonase (cycloisomerase 2 family)
MARHTPLRWPPRLLARRVVSPTAPAQYTVGGTVAGLNAGASVTLKNNGSDTVTVMVNGSFVLPLSLVNAAAYNVTVGTQPTGETCTASHALGTVDSASVASISVVCPANAPTNYTVGGTVSGLGTGASVTLLENGTDATTVSANGAFTFPTALPGGASYAVTVASQPAGETCSVSNASGSGIGANVMGVTVACSPNPTYSIGGSVSGLSAGASVALENNGSDLLTVATNGTFVFSTQLASSATYDVTVTTQPAAANCTVTNGSGTVSTANVTSVSVTCVPAQFVYADDSNGGIYAYAVDASTGSLTPLTGSPFASGGEPSVMAINPAGTFAYLALADRNTVAAFAVNAVTGALTPVASGSAASGDDPYNLAVTPSGKFAYATNLNSNNVSGFTIDAVTGALTPIGTFAAGHTPYGLAIDPAGRFVYVSNYLDGSVSAFTIDATTGALTLVAGSPYPAGSQPIAIGVNPAGTFVYTANAGGGISAYLIDQMTGRLTSIGTFGSGIQFEGIKFNAAGTLVYMPRAGATQIYAYAVDSSSGALTAIAGSPFATGPGPIAFAIDTSGTLIYVATTGGGVSDDTINTSTGALTALPGSPFTAGPNTQSVVITP